MKNRVVPPLLLRLLVYCVVIPLALLALVPGSFDIVHLIGTGDIPLRELLGSPGEVKRAPPRAKPPADAFVQDLGHGRYRLAKWSLSDVPNSMALSRQLNAQARRLCAAQMGQPRVTQGGEYSSKGLNEADIEFHCEPGLPAAPVHAVPIPAPTAPAPAQVIVATPVAPSAPARVVVRFNSPGSGPNVAGLEAMKALLGREEAALGHAIRRSIRHWGREGEVTMCFALAEYDAAGQAHFVSELREALRASASVEVAENARCA